MALLGLELLLVMECRRYSVHYGLILQQCGWCNEGAEYCINDEDDQLIFVRYSMPRNYEDTKIDCPKKGYEYTSTDGIKWGHGDT